MPKTRIHIVSFALHDHSFLETIRNDVSREFQTGVKIKEGHLDLSYYLDPTRRQYNANEILKEVHESFSQGNWKVIGLFNIDLFIPILTYIFGQAYLNGTAGIASTYRLNPTRYGMKADSGLFLTRTVKEVIHELGHTYGLIHCYNVGCVMNSSTYVEDIDQKESQLCPDCQNSLSWP